MKKSYVLIGLFLIMIIFITIIGSIFITGDILVKEEKDILKMQSNKEVYFNVYGYSVDNPNVIINPYGNSPLTAIVMFETSDYSEVEITIKSKNGNSDINYKFDKDKYHVIPIYGLYANYDNTVVIRTEGKEKVINIKTDKMPDDFLYVYDAIYDNFMFYNNNYPYAIDIEGEVRWYLNSNYFGNITFMDNSNIIIGSDKYNEEGNTISFYRMNLLGKIYNEYLLTGDYYGYNTLYNDNILVLSDNILLIDSQSGNIIRKYIRNEDYNYLDVRDGSIIVGKEEEFFIVQEDFLEEYDYVSYRKKYSFYNNTSNYNIVPSNRYGRLKETSVSDKKITLVNYTNIDKLDGIYIEKDVNRIKVTNGTGDVIYLILDKFLDKRVYEISDLKYISTFGLGGKYTIYFKVGEKIYRTDYYIEV